jgi:hypothetical protein
LPLTEQQSTTTPSGCNANATMVGLCGETDLGG